MEQLHQETVLKCLIPLTLLATMYVT